jgi:hypothetical protein
VIRFHGFQLNQVLTWFRASTAGHTTSKAYLLGRKSVNAMQKRGCCPNRDEIAVPELPGRHVAAMVKLR